MLRCGLQCPWLGRGRSIVVVNIFNKCRKNMKHLHKVSLSNTVHAVPLHHHQTAVNVLQSNPECACCVSIPPSTPLPLLGRVMTRSSTWVARRSNAREASSSLNPLSSICIADALYEQQHFCHTRAEQNKHRTSCKARTGNAFISFNHIRHTPKAHEGRRHTNIVNQVLPQR